MPLHTPSASTRIIRPSLAQGRPFGFEVRIKPQPQRQAGFPATPSRLQI